MINNNKYLKHNLPYRKRKIDHKSCKSDYVIVKLTATPALTIILAISMLVAATAVSSSSSHIYVKSNGNLLSLSYAERAAVGGGKQNDIVDIKSAENKTSSTSAAFTIFNQPSTWNIGSNAKSD